VLAPRVFLCRVVLFLFLFKVCFYPFFILLLPASS
jgi:hypothetical protein